MSLGKRIHSLSLLICVWVCKTNSDPCTDYADYVVTGTSSPSYEEPDFAKSRCDSTLTPQWYRISGDAGEDLATSGVTRTTQCGTTNPVWLMDSLSPECFGEVNATACVLTAFSSCHTTLEIKVKNCCGYRVYYLQQTQACPQAYCVDTISASPCAAESTCPAESSSYSSTGVTESGNSKGPMIGGVIAAVVIFIAAVVIASIVLLKFKARTNGDSAQKSEDFITSRGTREVNPQPTLPPDGAFKDIT